MISRQVLSRERQKSSNLADHGSASAAGLRGARAAPAMAGGGRVEGRARGDGPPAVAAGNVGHARRWRRRADRGARARRRPAGGGGRIEGCARGTGDGGQRPDRGAHARRSRRRPDRGARAPHRRVGSRIAHAVPAAAAGPDQGARAQRRRRPDRGACAAPVAAAGSRGARCTADGGRSEGRARGTDGGGRRWRRPRMTDLVEAVYCCCRSRC